jgi:hypothetical protein
VSEPTLLCRCDSSSVKSNLLCYVLPTECIFGRCLTRHILVVASVLLGSPFSFERERGSDWWTLPSARVWLGDVHKQVVVQNKWNAQDFGGSDVCRLFSVRLARISTECAINNVRSIVWKGVSFAHLLGEREFVFGPCSVAFRVEDHPTDRKLSRPSDNVQ